MLNQALRPPIPKTPCCPPCPRGTTLKQQLNSQLQGKAPEALEWVVRVRESPLRLAYATASRRQPRLRRRKFFKKFVTPGCRAPFDENVSRLVRGTLRFSREGIDTELTTLALRATSPCQGGEFWVCEKCVATTCKAVASDCHAFLRQAVKKFKFGSAGNHRAPGTAVPCTHSTAEP